MSDDHWHYSSDIHGGAEEHHRHYDTESELRELRSLVAGLRKDLSHAEDRIHKLERSTPSAIQAQHEADTAMADLRASGWSEYDDPAYRGG